MDDKEGACALRVCACRAGLAVGVVWGGCMLLMGIAAVYTDSWGHAWVELMGNVYVGYKATWGGAVVGMVWGLIDGFIAGAVVVGLYNLFSRCGTCCCNRPKADADTPPQE